jgi:hypothetical protein
VTGSSVFGKWVLPLLVVFSLTLFLAAAQGQIAIAPSSVNFGSVPVGNTQTQSVNMTNVGTSSVSVSKISVSGTGYAAGGLTLPYTLSPGQTVALRVAFTPPAAGTDTGSVSVSGSTTNQWNWRRGRYSRWGASAGVGATAALSGTGVAAAGSGQVTASPASLAFGSILPGSSQTLMETLTNAGTASVTVSGATMSSGSFAVNGLTLPMTLAGGQSVTFGVVFSPSGTGTLSGTLAILSNASNAQLNIGLSGTGAAAGQLKLTPTALNFGNVTTGTSSSLNGTLTASGTSVTISAAASTSPEFGLSGISLPMTLAAGQSVGFMVTFLPQSTGTAGGTLSFASNAGNATVTAALSGSGVAPAQHSVGLSWSPSSSGGVVGYNVYRGSVSGGPYAQMTSMDASAAYTDNTVSGGQTYYYVVTSVDSSGAESAYSNQAKAVVPSP